MQNGWFSSKKTPQSFYFTDDHAIMPGWCKGMELIIKEQGLYLEWGLKAQCKRSKCVVGQKDWCCHCVVKVSWKPVHSAVIILDDEVECAHSHSKLYTCAKLVKFDSD